MRLRSWCLVLLSGLLAFSLMSCSGGGGDAEGNSGSTLDPTFGSEGKVLTDIGSNTPDVAFGMLIQPGDGKAVVVGQTSNGANDDFAIVRYTTAGALDPAFGTGGRCC